MLDILAARDPDEALIYTPQGEVSCARFIKAVQAAKQWLTIQQVRQLGLLLDNEPAWLVWDIAAQELDVCLVPLPTFFSKEQISHIVTTAGLTHVVFSDIYAALLASCEECQEQALANDLVAHCRVRENMNRPFSPYCQTIHIKSPLHQDPPERLKVCVCLASIVCSLPTQ